MAKDLTIEEFNEPVFFCRSCHSIHIIKDDSMAYEDWDGTYCGKCHSTDIGTTKFGIWLAEEELREERRRQREWNK